MPTLAEFGVGQGLSSVASFPPAHSIGLIGSSQFNKYIPKCQQQQGLFSAVGMLETTNQAECFPNGLLPLKKKESEPLTVRVGRWRAFRSVLLSRVLKWPISKIAYGENFLSEGVLHNSTAASRSLCAGTRKPRLLIAVRCLIPQHATTKDCRPIHGRDILKRIAIEEGFEVEMRDFQDSFEGGNKKGMAEQMADLAEFDVLMSRHGAGLTWCKVMPSHAVVVEMVAKGAGDVFGTAICVRWSPQDRHFGLFMNWVIESGLAYINWESGVVAEKKLWLDNGKHGPHSQNDWKSGVFVVTEAEARTYIRRSKEALLANANCPGVDLPDKVVHYRLGNYTRPGLAEDKAPNKCHRRLRRFGSSSEPQPRLRTIAQSSGAYLNMKIPSVLQMITAALWHEAAIPIVAASLGLAVAWRHR